MPRTHPFPVTIREKGRGLAAINRKPILMVGVCMLSKKGKGYRAFFQGILGGIGDCIHFCSSRPIILAGDINVHSSVWGCKPRQEDARGAILNDWATAMGLVLVTLTWPIPSTCVRWQGESTINITSASPSVAHKLEWAVDVEAETLSDYKYITCLASGTAQWLGRRRGENPSRRWALHKMDLDRFVAAVFANTWQPDHQTGIRDRRVAKEADAITRIVVKSCDATMQRSWPRSGRLLVDQGNSGS